jgi:hypothetical protein
MNNIKKPANFALRMLGAGIFAAISIGTGVALYGWLRGWETTTQFSNGMFVSGAAVIILGVLTIAGGFTSRGNFAITYSQSAGDSSGPDRAKQMILDILRGYNALVFSAITGTTLIVLSILIYNLFG